MHWKINRYHNALKIKEDLSNTWEMEAEFEALTEQGAQAIGQYTKSYNRDLETTALAEAYTHKADGRKIAVHSSAIQTQVGVVSGGNGISWPNVNVIQVTFPDVQKGDRTYVRFIGAENKLSLPNWLRRQEYIDPALTWDEFSYSVQAPVGSPVQLIAVGLTVNRSENAGQTTWQIGGKYKSKSVDSRIANWQTSIPRLLLSSFSKQEQFATAYSEENNKKVLVDAEIKRLANTITQGQSTDYAKAQAIYDWIRQNIRYIASYIGQGGYIPHDISDVLKTRYGDCKDHQLLLQTLLSAVDIEAVPAMINAAAPQYELQDLPVGFDHVITYIPSLQLFVDATASLIPFGHLPWSDADRPVAVALSSGAVLMRTPSTTATENTVSSVSVWNIKADGKADLDISIQTTGYASTEMQNQLEQIPAGMSGVAIQRILKESGWQGQGFAQFPAVQRKELAQTMNAQVEVRNFVSDPSGGSSAPNPQLALKIYTADNLGLYTQGNREFSTVCTPITVNEVFELIFDNAHKIIRVPKNYSFKSLDGIVFSAEYELHGNTLKGKRNFTTLQPRHYCTAEQYATRLPSLQAIAQHLNASVLFTK